VPKQRKQEGEGRRAPKFKFKRDLKEIVGDIHMSNKQLFPLAALRRDKGQDGFDGEDIYLNQSPANTSRAGNYVNNFINYENDNFFETDDDRLILLKKI